MNFKKYLIFTALFLFGIGISLPLKSQVIEPALPKQLNWKTVETEFYNLLNDLRTQRKLKALKPGDPVLNAAAFDQAIDMSAHNRLSHQQSNRQKATPYKRVQFYNGTYTIVGENCIMIFLDTPMKTKYERKDITVSTEKEIAHALFMGWKNSPDHFKNMMTKEYQDAGLGYAFDEKTKQLYCTQVFGGYVQTR